MTFARAIDLGRMGYAEAHAAQIRHLEEVLASRDAGRPEVGRLLLVEHDPVITVTRRAGAIGHVLASPERLRAEGVELVETDRGGDVTYHGPGQLVCYPILDLNLLNLGLHAYMRLLESAVIAAIARFGVPGARDPSATGVWVDELPSPGPSPRHAERVPANAKICAMGVRVRKWATMHGLALNVSPNLRHFDLIVPCGLVGRSVTTLNAARAARGMSGVTIEDVKPVLVEELDRELGVALDAAARARHAAGDAPTKLIC